MNTFTRTLTYVMRCNTDVTSLLSGTALKTVVTYVTEYVTKCGLKSYHIFDAVKNTILKNGELVGGDMKRQEKARKLMTKIVDSLTSKSEIGAPLAALYLLGNADHYTSHEFRACYWKNYVRRVVNAFDHGDAAIDLEDDIDEEKVMLEKIEDRYVGVLYVDDYEFRPDKWKDMDLYSWIRLGVKVKISKAERALLSEVNSECESESESNGDGSDDDSSQSARDIDLDLHKHSGSQAVGAGQFLKGHPQ